jgi:hypothetical protein
LAEAEPLARNSRDDRALAELHYLRGNLYFARGELMECRSQHELALEAARRVESPEWQAQVVWPMHSTWIVAWQRHFPTLLAASTSAKRMI